MDTTEKAKKVLEIFDDINKSVDFTIHMNNLKTNEKEVYNEVIRLLQSGHYKVKYLNTAATS